MMGAIPGSSSPGTRIRTSGTSSKANGSQTLQDRGGDDATGGEGAGEGVIVFDEIGEADDDDQR